MITALTPKTKVPVPGKEKAVGLLKPLLLIVVALVAKDENDNQDSGAQAILANDGVSVSVTIFGEEMMDFEAATSGFMFDSSA